MIENHGAHLRMMLRNVEFAGFDFDSFEPVGLDASDSRLSQFTLAGIGLCNCTLKIELPVTVITQGERPQAATLLAELVLGKPRQRDSSIDQEVLQLSLKLGGETYASAGTQGWFDDEMRSLRNAMSAGTYIKSCHSCAFSDYPIAGYGLFGMMLCYRNHKDWYLGLRPGLDYKRMWTIFEQQVQETYLCPEYQPRALDKLH